MVKLSWNVLDRVGPNSSLKESGGFKPIHAVTSTRRYTYTCIHGRTMEINPQDDVYAFLFYLVRVASSFTSLY